MKPKILHEEAMNLSFKAKQASEIGDQETSFQLYKEAALLESKVAEYYFDKPELEPTRSILIRSAAYLNLKAGLIEDSQRFIFYGLLHIKDDQIRNQLNDALEFSIALKSIDAKTVSKNYEYITRLRQRSIHYILEPATFRFNTAVSLEMIHDFTESYLKSLKAYAGSVYKRFATKFSNSDEDIELGSQRFKELVIPLVANTGFGSFKFSVANDFLSAPGESKELVKLKANIVNNYHTDIFINPLTKDDIVSIKNEYSDNEINDIFRPITKIKSIGSPYKIGYFDRETFNKVPVPTIINSQKKDLLPIKQITQEDIGILESSIIHTRNSVTGKVSRSTIFREQLKSYEFDIKTNQIEPNEIAPLILNKEIVINVIFNSENGFTFCFDDLKIEKTETEYHKGLSSFFKLLYDRIINLCNLDVMTENDYRDFTIVKKLINNTEELKKH